MKFLKMRWPLAAYLLFLLAPLVVMIFAAITTSWSDGPLSGGPTGKWLSDAWQLQSPLLRNSLFVAVQAVLIDASIGLPFAVGAFAIGPRFARFAEQFVRTPLVVPGLAIGLGLVSLYPALRPGGHLLVAAHVAATLPFFLAPVFPALADSRIDECDLVASTLGAKPNRRLVSITLPMLAPAAITGAVMAFTFSLGEFNASFFVVPPAEKTLPFGLADAFINQRLEMAAASALLFLALVIPCGIIFQLAFKRATRSSLSG